MDSSFDDAVVELLSCGSREGRIKITSSSLFSFGETVGLTHGRETNQLV